MENQLQIFDNPEFGTIRTILIDGEIWFVAADVCRALDIQNVTQAVAILNEDEKSKISENRITIDPIQNIGSTGTPFVENDNPFLKEVNIVNEPGLYHLIFQSRKPNAVKFQRWVYHEVLPSIRKHGYYAVPSIEMLLKQIAKESAKNDEELACLAAQMPVLSLQIRAMIKKFLADYEKEKKNPVPVILNLLGEKWEWIKGFEGLYQVSTEGRVRSFFRGKCRILKPTVGHRGYFTICLYRFDEKTKKMRKKTFRLNRIVAETFIPNPLNLPEVHHKDDNKANNAAWNLEWVTGEKNREYAHKSGLYLKGEKNPSAKLTEKDVRFIREHYKAGDPEFGNIALAERFKVSDVTITNIVTFKSWKHIQ